MVRNEFRTKCAVCGTSDGKRTPVELYSDDWITVEWCARCVMDLAVNTLGVAAPLSVPDKLAVLEEDLQALEEELALLRQDRDALIHALTTVRSVVEDAEDSE